MKRLITFILTIVMISTVLFTSAVPFSAAASLDPTQKVSFDVSCSKDGYEFSVYKVASLTTSTSPYEVKYVSDITAISTPIVNGDTAALLSALDNLNSLPTAIATMNSTTAKTKEFSNLDQGIYYVKATNYPAGVKSVTNSVVSLPYFDKTNGWTYTIDTINLAEKVVDDVPEIKKEITNSTKNNVNFTDVSLGDTVNFDITATTAGSLSFKLKEYIITDDMSKGLSLLTDSFSVKLIDKDGKTVSTLQSSDFEVVKVSEKAGEDTKFTVSLKTSVLNGTDFYKSENVIVSYKAKLNKYATTAFTGNPNTATKLKYTNKNGVSSEVEGNTVYVYTYTVTVNKTNESAQPLSGAKFALYKSENDAKSETNEVATGTSDNTGKVEFFNSNNEKITLQSGKYYMKETEAPEGYNRYTLVIPVEITVQYGSVIADGTYITSAPAGGVATINVKNTKTVLPQTGGMGSMFIYIISATTLAAAITLFVIRKKKISSK